MNKKIKEIAGNFFMKCGEVVEILRMIISDKFAIDQMNILKERTENAKKLTKRLRELCEDSRLTNPDDALNACLDLEKVIARAENCLRIWGENRTRKQLIELGNIIGDLSDENKRLSYISAIQELEDSFKKNDKALDNFPKIIDNLPENEEQMMSDESVEKALKKLKKYVNKKS